MADGGARWEAAIEVLDRVAPGGDRPTVLREGLSLLVRRGPAVVRVRPRSDEPIAAREVEVAEALTEALVPHTSLAGPPGQPYVVGSSVVTAWRWVDAVSAATPTDLGELAAALLERTTGGAAYAVGRFDPLAAIRHAVGRHPVGDDEADFVRRRAHELGREWSAIADADPSGVGIVHGDLHRDNVVVGPLGPVLTDLELAGAGPPSYDVAPAVVAVDRYGAEPATLDAVLAARGHDPRGWPGFATCVAVYELWVTAWAVGVRDRSPALAREAAHRVASLRDGTRERWVLQ